MVKKEEFLFDSRDGSTRIHAVRWIPEGKICCILQIVHGMAEYVERYEELAMYLAEKGIMVTGEDHLGHGKSVPTNGTYGYFCEQDPATVVVRDVHRLKKMNQEEYPGIPYVILGHSMGSFILRNYLFRYGTGIQGAIVCGTGSKPKVLVKMCLVLERIGQLFLGSSHVARMMDKMAFGSYNKRIRDPKTQFDWLCTDEEVVRKYRDDPMCGFTFTLNGFRTLFTLLDRQNREELIHQMPKDLPVWFIAGKEDPVGDYGNGVHKALEDFRKTGMERTSLTLYENGRHEILNEPVRHEIYEEIYAWLMERVEEY